MRRPLTAVAAFALLAVGCQSKPVNAFHPWETPKETATIVEGDGVYCQIVNAYLIGEDPDTELFHDKDSHTYTIPAGPTKLMVGYEKRGGGTAFSGGPGVTLVRPQKSIPKQLSFVAEVGHTYTFESILPFFRPTLLGDLENDEWDVRVLDKADKRVVAQTRDREPAAKPSAASAQASATR